jgi:hypothetical protein
MATLDPLTLHYKCVFCCPGGQFLASLRPADFGTLGHLKSTPKHGCMYTSKSILQTKYSARAANLTALQCDPKLGPTPESVNWAADLSRRTTVLCLYPRKNFKSAHCSFSSLSSENTAAVLGSFANCNFVQSSTVLSSISIYPLRGVPPQMKNRARQWLMRFDCGWPTVTSAPHLWLR